MEKTKICRQCFKSLGIKSRMEIYTFLKKSKEATVNQVTNEVGLRQPTISYHLHMMQDQGLLKSRKNGKEVFFSINSHCSIREKKCILENLSFEE